jgi:GH15 family glucan-1,4-alpha-glucosidase
MTSQAGERPSPHVLRDYALIADGERGAVIGPQGDFAWLCFPSWESPSVFGGLLGAPGAYVVTPAETRRVWGGYYDDKGLIWNSRWVTADAVVECRQALARPTTSDRLVVISRVRVESGRVRMRALLDLRSDFGGNAMTGLRLADGVWTGRSGDVGLRWTGAADARVSDGLRLEFELSEGQEYDLVLELFTGDPDGPPPDPGALWAETEADWHKRVPGCDDTLAPRDARLAYAVLTGLTSAEGGMVAAATTSLPEHLAASRNYDYRYAWIRDQCFAGQAVAAHGGCLDLLDSAVTFVTDRLLEHGDRMRPAYTVSGEEIPDESHRDLPGYPGSGVVVGNRVREQFQLDVFGEALLLLSAAARRDRLTDRGARAAAVAAQAIADRRDEPEAGIWETERRLWTHSRLICAAGLRTAARTFGTPRLADTWNGIADTVLAEATQHGLHRSGRWRRAPDDDRIDAALLMPALRGALPADDPRTVATVRAVRDELEEEGFVYRYRVDHKELGEVEGAFALCGFMLALAEAEQGMTTDALRRFERTRSACGTTGLFTEEYDVKQRQLRANLPQAFVHALFLETATRLSPAGPGAFR